MNFPRPVNYSKNENRNFNNAFDSMRVNNAVYQQNPKDMFNNNNFRNDNSLVYDNLYKDLLLENIKEYTVLIDSKDRNYQIFPNPFHYDVTFDPMPTSKSHETPAPTINTGFTNVRYIRLETAILPFYDSVTEKVIEVPGVKDDIGLPVYVKKESVDKEKKLTDNLYIVIVIEEYQDVNMKSTNDLLSDSFGVLYYDDDVNNYHFRACPFNAIKIFPPDQLGKIDKFRIRFYDPYGCELNVEHLDKSVKSNMSCGCANNVIDRKCFRHNLRHPLNPFFQNHLQFKVGVVEPHLNKKNFY